MENEYFLICKGHDGRRSSALPYAARGRGVLGMGHCFLYWLGR